MKYIILISLLISCEKLDFKKYVIITPEGRIVCNKQIDDKNYTDCVNDYFREEKISSVYSGGSVVLEIEKE